MATISFETDRGDTLIELLVALVIIAFAVVALLGGLLTSTSTSVTHRNLAKLDNLVRSFTAAVQSAISGQPGSNPTPSLLFQTCNATYTVAGPIYPSTQAVGNFVSVPVMGLASSSALTATLTPTGGPGVTVPAGTTSTTGAAVATFAVPSGLSGQYSLTISDSTPTIVNAGTLTVGAANNDAMVGNYTLTTALTYWNGTSFVSAPPCSNTQQLSVTLNNNDPSNGGSDSANIILTSTSDLAVPTESVADSPGTNEPLGTNIRFTANVTGTPTAPTGNVAWTFSGAPNGTTCTGGNTTMLVGGSASCDVENTTQGAGCTIPAAGGYTAAAAYQGDSNWTGTSSEVTSGGDIDTIIVNQGTPTVTTSYTGPNPATIGSSLTFTATVAESGVCITPTGSVTWSFPPGTPLGAACSGGSNTTALSNGTATCTVTPALPGTYTPVATYNGDANFASGESGNQASVAVGVKAPSVTTVTESPANPAVGSTMTFTATVTGVPGLTPTGNVLWTVTPPSGPAPTCANSTLDASGQGTCTVNNSELGTYTVNATYLGDANYSGSSGSDTVSVGQATPTVPVSPKATSSKGTRTLTFTATVTPPSPSGPTPTGTLTWTVTASDGSTPNCVPSSPSLSSGAGNTSTGSCSITGSTKSVTYTATASYSGDPNYTTATGVKDSTG